MARTKHEDRKARRLVAQQQQQLQSHGLAEPSSGSSSDSERVGRATACSRRSISPAQRALFFKAFALWMLFSLCGYLSIDAAHLPIFSHCVGFCFFLVLTTRRTRWVVPVVGGTLLFCLVCWWTLPPQLHEHYFELLSNSFGWTAFGTTCLVVTGCTVVRKSMETNSAATAQGEEGAEEASMDTRRGTTRSSGFRRLRNRVLESSCGDSSIGFVCSGRFIEEHLEQRGYVTLNESTGRVSTLALPLPLPVLGFVGAGGGGDDSDEGGPRRLVRLGVDVEGAVASATSTASKFAQEVGAILRRVAQEQDFVTFLHTALQLPEGEGSHASASEGGEGASDADAQPRQIHILATDDEPSSADDVPSPVPSPAPLREGEEGGEEGAAQTSSSPPPGSSPEGTPSPASSPAPPTLSAASSNTLVRASSDNSGVASSSNSDLGSSVQHDGEDAASFLSRASRAHLYAVIRHLNSQLLSVESSLSASSLALERHAAERHTFERTIRTLKTNLDRECAARMQLSNELWRAQEEARLEAKRAAKAAAHARPPASTSSGDGGNTDGADGVCETGVSIASSTLSGSSLSVSDQALLKQAQLHAKDLSKKLKQCRSEAWNASHALAIARQREKTLEENLAQEQRHANDRDAAAKRLAQQCQAAERALSAEKEEQTRALAQVNQHWQGKVRAAENQKSALEKQLAAAKESAAAAKASASASAAAIAAADSAAAPAASPDAASTSAALVEQLRAQLSDATSQMSLLSQQLSQQDALVSSLSSDKGFLSLRVSALESALADARSQLSVEQTIVTSLSSAAGDPSGGGGEGTLWEGGATAGSTAGHRATASPSSPMFTSEALLASIFERGYGEFGSFDSGISGGDEDASGSSASSSVVGEDADSLSLSRGWDHVAAPPLVAGAETTEEDALDPAVVAELDAAQLASVAVGDFLPGALPLPAAAGATSLASSLRGSSAGGSAHPSSWSLYSSLSPSAATFVPASLQPPSWHPLQGPLLAGTESQSPPLPQPRGFSWQLDALEARIKQLKQQQAEQQQLLQSQPVATTTGATAPLSI